MAKILVTGGAGFRELGWIPAVTLEQGLEKTFSYQTEALTRGGKGFSE